MNWDWLNNEIDRVHLPGFHQIEKPPDEVLSNIQADERLPQSYRDFVAHFGSAYLFESPTGFSAYRLGVIAPPTEQSSSAAEPFIKLGHFDGASAWIKARSANEGSFEPTITEIEGKYIDYTDLSFYDWLRERTEWLVRKTADEHPETPPEPFTPEEQSVVKARDQYKWSVIDIDEDGQFVFHIYNGSSRILPYITVGVVSFDGRLSGATRLSTGSIPEESEGEVRRSIYPKLKAPRDLKLFELPSPQPKDRYRFWELSKGKR